MKYTWVGQREHHLASVARAINGPPIRSGRQEAKRLLSRERELRAG